jgi:hypothetical protein
MQSSESTCLFSGQKPSSYTSLIMNDIVMLSQIVLNRGHLVVPIFASCRQIIVVRYDNDIPFTIPHDVHQQVPAQSVQYQYQCGAIAIQKKSFSRAGISVVTVLVLMIYYI